MLRDYTASDARAWLQLLNVSRDNSLTLSQFEARERAHPPSDFRFRLIITKASEALAIGQLAHSPYIPADHLSTLVVVAESARRRGFGSAVLERLREEARRRQYRGLACDVRESDVGTLSWARRRGFRNHVRRFLSELDLTHFDPLEPERRLEILRQRGLVVSSMDEETMSWKDVLPFFRDRVAESPDLADLPPWSVEHCRAIIETNPNGRADWTVVAHSGANLVAIAVMHRLGADAYLYFVGVVRDARGQRIAPALVSMLAQRAAAEGCRLLKIDNMDSNHPALRVNEQLGFIRRPGRIELRRVLSF